MIFKIDVCPLHVLCRTEQREVQTKEPRAQSGTWFRRTFLGRTQP